MSRDMDGDGFEERLRRQLHSAAGDASRPEDPLADVHHRVRRTDRRRRIASGGSALALVAAVAIAVVPNVVGGGSDVALSDSGGAEQDAAAQSGATATSEAQTSPSPSGDGEAGALLDRPRTASERSQDDGALTSEEQQGQTGAESADGADAGPALSATCENAETGYRVDYPQGWLVTADQTPDITVRCELFDPEPASIDSVREPMGVAVFLMTESVPYERLIEDALQGQEKTVISRDEVTVAGRSAVAAETRLTEDGPMSEAGRQSYAYYVDLGEQTLVASTHDSGEQRYERNKAVLDAMMGSLTLSSTSGS
jgi:hypothetical protein